MSTVYWIIEGVGINTYNIIPYIDKVRFTKKLLEDSPENEVLQDIVENGTYEKWDAEALVCESNFDNIADVLCHCDDTDAIVYGSDGEGSYYFYYPPSMPWQHKDNEPKTIEEVHRRIITAVQKIADISNEDIDKMIDDELYEVGCG